MKTANENGCSVILANDPDSDRMALAEKQPKLVTYPPLEFIRHSNCHNRRQMILCQLIF